MLGHLVGREPELAPWHDNVRAGDAATAEQIARSRARAAGVDLVVAAAIAPDT